MIGPADTTNDAQTKVGNVNYINFNNQTNPSIKSAKGCTSFVVEWSNLGWGAINTSAAIVNYRINVFDSQYGGNSYENRTINVTVPCSDVIYADIAIDILTADNTTVTMDNQMVTVDSTLQRIVNEGYWANMNYGDVFINYFDVSTLLSDLEVTVDNTYAETVYVPLESYINTTLRESPEQRHCYNLNHAFGLLRQEMAGEYESSYAGQTYKFNQTVDLYSYNFVYSEQTAVQNGISPALDEPTETVFDCVVKASNVKYNGEMLDSWTKFSVNEEIEVDSTYGAITALENFRDRLLFFQEHGFGILSVNERSLIAPGSTSQLVLGTGGLLSRYDYVSSSVGTNNRSTIVQSQTGIYWFDPTDKSLYRFTDALINVSKTKLMQSWFNINYVPTHYVHGVHDSKYNEVIYSLFDGVNNFTLAFNEAIDAFTSFYSFETGRYIPFTDGGYFSTTVAGGVESVYYHNSRIGNRCRFYGYLVDSSIKFVVNDNYGLTKVFDTVFFHSTTFDTTGKEKQLITFSDVRYSNTTQNTGYETLVYQTNLERREKGWTSTIPRNALILGFPDNNDIYNEALLDTTTLFRDRMRDKYLIVDLTFTNANGNRFICPYFGINYRISPR
jgi:hypothetical protein